MFYGIAAAENLMVYGAEPPPKQGFYIYPDRAFHEWWTNHLKWPPLDPDPVIPVLLAMQGYPKSPRLWEKHADSILRDVRLTPKVHEPCPYSGMIMGKRVVLK